MAPLPDNASDAQAAVWFHAELVEWCEAAGVKGMNRHVGIQVEIIRGWITEGLMSLCDPVDGEEACAE